MPVFAIFRVAQPAKMEAALATHFPENHLKVGDGEWLVAGHGTAKDISDKLQITGTDSKTGAAIVISIANYYGRATSEIWDWVKSKAETSGG